MGIDFSLGKRLTPEEVGHIVGLNPKTVKKHYQRFGGQKIGSRYIFFERLVADALSAGAKMDRPSPGEGAEDPPGLLDEERGQRLGVETKADTRRRLEQNDKYGLFTDLKRS